MFISIASAAEIVDNKGKHHPNEYLFERRKCERRAPCAVPTFANNY